MGVGREWEQESHSRTPLVRTDAGSTGHGSQVNRVTFIATLVLKRLALLYYYYYHYYYYYYSLIVENMTNII